MMINEKMEALGKKRSAIREIFEYGNQRRSEIGADKVFDFSLGNPSIPAPEKVTETMQKLLRENDPVALHGYTSAPGAKSVCTAIADDINRRFGADASPEDIYMTCGAAASLTVSLNAVVVPGDEVIVLAPFFPEYTVFVEKAGGTVKPVLCRESDFQIDPQTFKAAVTPKTKAVIINSPNNPSGAVFSAQTIKELAAVLKEKQKEYGTQIFILADEPYRELVYGDTCVPYIPNYYDNTLVCYSFSKSLSLPGERIGYIFVSPKVTNGRDVYAAVCGAGRALGFVCAPSMMQLTVAQCLGLTSDLKVYETNRNLFYTALTEYGYTVVKPDGAFYLFVKSPQKDAAAFCERAKKYEILLVPSDSFGIEGYVRICYCVSTETIRNSLPGFKKLMEEYR